MSVGNLPSDAVKSATEQYFNNFYKQPTSIGNAHDAINAYFQTITGSVDTGKALASAVIFAALQQGLDPMSVVEQFKRLSDKNRLTSPAYINSTNQSAQDTNTYVDGVWVVGDKQYAKPGPSQLNNSISELDAYLTMFLNLNRAGTSLLGLGNSPHTSKYITRAILA